jgi:hypothetical protein
MQQTPARHAGQRADLVRKLLLAGLLGLGLVDELDEVALVLEDVTLHAETRLAPCSAE